MIKKKNQVGGVLRHGHLDGGMRESECICGDSWARSQNGYRIRCGLNHPTRMRQSRRALEIQATTMSEAVTLRSLRTANAKLMKGNLALLMAIREVDSEIQRQWTELQQCCKQLERNGIAKPESCRVLMGDEELDATEVKEDTVGEDEPMDS